MTWEHLAFGTWALAASGGAALLISALIGGIRAAVRAVGRHGLKVIALVTLVGLLASCHPSPSPDTVEVTSTTYVTGVMK